LTAANEIPASPDNQRRYCIMVVPLPSKQEAGVRFPLPALRNECNNKKPTFLVIAIKT
jgi:hypothetical protein